jgi:hypothetical protein
MNFFEGFSNFIRSCIALFDVNWRWWAGGATATIVIAITRAIQYPESAFNRFFIFLIDIVAFVLPSTPSQFKLSSLARNFALAIPQQLGHGVVFELLSGVFGLLSIYLIYKAYKSIPLI